MCNEVNKYDLGKSGHVQRKNTTTVEENKRRQIL